jgi:cyclic pyranopterin phosphate synthase
MQFSHLDESGNAKMVDVSAKAPQIRVAVATGEIILAPETIAKINDNTIAKGNVLTVAQIAGISAAKKTSELIPLCHNLPLNQVSVDFEVGGDRIKAIGTAKCTGVTGVEMEALTAVTVALLTIYDMCKAVDKQMVLANIKLLKKEKTDVI